MRAQVNHDQAFVVSGQVVVPAQLVLLIIVLVVLLTG